MDLADRLKILFIINTRSGNQSINWEKEIRNYFQSLDFCIQIYTLDPGCDPQKIEDKIAAFSPDKVVAVGGDGTVGLVAGCLLQKNIPLGILPAGSANGMAKELGISEHPSEALRTITDGAQKKIHVVIINGKLCLHLSDIGFNARMIERFQNENSRGIWGYLKATIKVARYFLFKNPMQVLMMIDGVRVERKVAMIVIANATKYGSGAVINPFGDLEDDWFEIIVVKKISLIEVFKMLISHSPFNPNKTEIFKTRSLKMQLSKKMHFQVDGEFFGRVKEIEAILIPAALQIIVPAKN